MLFLDTFVLTLVNKMIKFPFIFSEIMSLYPKTLITEDYMHNGGCI